MGKNKSSKSFAELNICALGASFGVAFGVGMIILALLSMWFNIGTPAVKLFATIFHGYTATYFGALIGFLWGLLDGFIFGFILGYVYNKFCCCHSCAVCCK